MFSFGTPPLGAIRVRPHGAYFLFFAPTFLNDGEKEGRLVVRGPRPEVSAEEYKE